jgi:DME family drug/metabolite transporter
VIVTKRLTRTLSPIAITFWNGVVGAVALSPLLLTADRIVPHGIRLLYVLLLGAVFTGLSGFVYVWLLSHVTAQAIGILSYIEPVSAALLAWALLGQGLGWQVGLGGVLVVGAGLLIVFFEPVDAPPLEAATVGSPRESAGRRDAVGGHPPPRRA